MRGTIVRALSLLVLVALILGLGLGAVVQMYAPERIDAVAIIEPFGALWLNLLRMTVIPLVFSLLVTSVASVADAAKTGRLAGRAILLFSILLIAAALYATAATLGLLSLFPVDRLAADAIIRGAAGDGPETIAAPSFADWLLSLAPANPIRAAAEDAVLPLVVFALFFGFAATRLQEAARASIVGFFRAVGEAMLVVVRWVLLAGPLGVFALALGVGARAGFGGYEVLVHYVVVVSAVTAGIAVIAVVLAIVLGRVAPGAFGLAAAPVLAVAWSTQSSLASLPSMLEAARALKIPERVYDLVLPLAVAVFRFTSPVANLAVAFFIAAIYGLEPTPLQIASAIIVSYPVSLAAVGLPGQVSFFTSMAPICLALGVPLEMLGVLIAVEIVPDIFRTVGNVMGDMAATTILSRAETESKGVGVANER